MFPPIQCSKSSYFTQWLLSEYLNRIEDPATPPEQPPQQPQTHQQKLSNHHNNHHHNVFTAKHFKHLFSSSSSSSSSPPSPSNQLQKPQKPNNNEYKNGTTTQNNPPTQDSIKNIEFIQLLALNALEFTAPIYSFINKNSSQQKQQSQTQLLHQKTQQKSEEPARKSEKKNCKCPSTRSFVQLSGHPESFAPAGPNTVWKKMPEEQGHPTSHNNNNDRKRNDSVKEGEGKICGGLKELLEKLDLRNGGGRTGGADGGGEPPQKQQLTRRPSIFPIHHQPTTEDATEDQDLENTTPITIFFNEEPEQPSSSTNQQTTLLPPKIYNIPTHLLPNECQIYRKVNSTNPPDPLTLILPKYVTETCYNSQMFIELEDLLTNFSKPNPTIMDIKLGTRTFLESEVRNAKPRPDLYQKLIKVDKSACTEEEHNQMAVTKLTYMLFRERQSSSCSLGFRVEGVKIGSNEKYYNPNDQLDDINFKILKGEDTISDVFLRFCKGSVSLATEVVKRLEFVLKSMESSDFFMGHEVIGSSLLFIHDDDVVGVWLIDFAKTFEVGDNDSSPRRLTHRDPWVMGNREDGVLVGVDNILRLFKGLV